jgi:hypothetical protein
LYLNIFSCKASQAFYKSFGQARSHLGLIMFWLANLSFLLGGTLNICKVVSRLGTLVCKELVNSNEIYDYMCCEKAPKKHSFIWMLGKKGGNSTNSLCLNYNKVLWHYQLSLVWNMGLIWKDLAKSMEFINS